MKKKNINNLLMMGILLFSSVFTSCMNEDEAVSQEASKARLVEVSHMKMWKKNLRRDVVQSSASKRKTSSSELDEDMPVLHFKDDQAYEYILSQLHEMTEEEKLEFFEDLGFEGAFTYMKKADDELDSIFDIEDDQAFIEAIGTYKEKYKGILLFNSEDEYDLTPTFMFDDKDMELVGNVAGYVVVGNELYEAEAAESFPATPIDDEYDNSGSNSPGGINYGQGPIVSRFMPLREIIKIKQGKYTSTMEIGYDNVSHNMLLHFISHKHKKLYKRKHPTGYQFDNFIINGTGGGKLIVPNKGKKEYWVNLYGWNLEVYNATWKEMTIVNFKSNRCWVDNASGTKSIRRNTIPGF